ncbi:hypothetical protein M422DRAFT_54345 [Sphaerobolus stellatus SS14]|uniref:Nucleolar GTP-binding protein 2 n=1 Tax=Sphaerobolus stellatus (strain SS14) TaxID=990650 RepID=A0A0C9UUW6_SPHS4|nr:hypothetical protein M422DRAFT_54345 [Sphaerobolus stellatus SS14]
MSKNKNLKFNLPTKKLKKDPGVPKLPAVKARVRTHPNRPAQQFIPNVPQSDVPMGTESSLASLAAEAATSSKAADLEDLQENESLSIAKRQYIRALHKVIDQSDVVILVLDARDPEGCRTKLVEDEVRRRESDGKRLVFVLNKIGMVHLSGPYSLR